jgi:proline racemase
MNHFINALLILRRKRVNKSYLNKSKTVIMVIPGEIMKVEKIITVFETHSSGETTKVVVSGFPHIPGKTMWEKTKYCQEHFDNFRKALMMQPRGFSGILGAIITEPTNPKADYGVIFMYTGGYFNFCGDSTFSVAKVLIEQGMVEVKEPVTEITLDTAAGLVKVEANVKDGEVHEISFEGTHPSTKNRGRLKFLT